MLHKCKFQNPAADSTAYIVKSNLGMLHILGIALKATDWQFIKSVIPDVDDALNCA